MKILVTGATGFIGSHLVQRLLRDKHQVHVLTRPGTDLDHLGGRQDRIVVHSHLGSTQNMIEIIKDARPDVVVHLASLFVGEHKSTDLEELINSNVLLSTQIVEAMSLNDVRQLINVGTSWQHYEDADYNPVNLYAATKQAFLSVVRFYVETSELKVISLELSDTYGPDDRRGHSAEHRGDLGVLLAHLVEDAESFWRSRQLYHNYNQVDDCLSLPRSAPVDHTLRDQPRHVLVPAVLRGVGELHALEQQGRLLRQGIVARIGRLRR